MTYNWNTMVEITVPTGTNGWLYSGEVIINGVKVRFPVGVPTSVPEPAAVLLKKMIELEQEEDANTAKPQNHYVGDVTIPAGKTLTLEKGSKLVDNSGPSEVVILPETELTAEGNGDAYITVQPSATPTEGGTAVITCNGVKYTSPILRMEPMFLMGNTEAMGVAGGNSDAPFLVAITMETDNGAYGMLRWLDEENWPDNDSVTLSIVQVGAASGGGTVEVDATLTKANAAADAKVVGDRFTSLSEEIVAVTPKKFGAVGDGVADDSDAIQSALNAGGLVYLPAGRYKITKTLTIGSNTTLMGDGDNSVIFLGDNGANLTPHYWYAEGEVDGVYPDYYPYITTAENAKDICISRIRVEGNTEEASENIHVGICAESATGVQIDHVSVWKINYFPELAPARPSGQWRRGWNVAFLRSERIELAHSTIQYGAYECVRIGTRTNDVWVHDCLIEYGWRTGLQVIEACNDVLVERCTINQDDFDAYDTNACITFHPSDANHIGAVVIRGCKITGKLYTGTAEGAGISVVYNAIDSLVIDDCTIKITSAGLPAILAFDNTKINGCTIVSAAAALALQNELVFPLCVENCTINATGDKAAVVTSGNVRIRGCTIDAASNHCVYAAPVDFASHLEISNSVINAPGTLNAVAIIKAANNSSTLGVSFDLDNNLLNGAIYINQPDVNLMRKCAIYGNTINVPAGKACVQNDYSSTAYKLLLINNNVMNGGNQAVKIWSAGMAIIKDNDMAGCTAGVAATNENNIIKDNILPG